jgi:hypothetical protein
MQRLSKYITLLIAAVGVIVLGSLGYNRFIYQMNCPTQSRSEKLDAPNYPQVTQIITDTTGTSIDAGWRQQIFTTNDPVEKVEDFYASFLEAQGWREVRQITDDGQGYHLIGYRETRLLPTYVLNLYTKIVDGKTMVKVNLGYDNNPCLAR